MDKRPNDLPFKVITKEKNKKGLKLFGFPTREDADGFVEDIMASELEIIASKDYPKVQ